MPAPYGLHIIENCVECKLRQPKHFCDLHPAALKQLDEAKSNVTYPADSILFMEGQEAHGMFLLCRGRVKLSISSADGKSVIVNIAEPGEALGLSAILSGRSYQATAETLEPCTVSFVKRENVIRLLQQHGDAALRAAEQLSSKYSHACHEIRSLGLAQSAAEKLAGFLIGQASHGQTSANPQVHFRLLLTHEEIGQIIGTSRETVTRLFANFKKRHLIDVRGASLLIRNMAGLAAAARQ